MTETERKAKAYSDSLDAFQSVLDDLIHEGELLEADLKDGITGFGMTRHCFEVRVKKKLMSEVICFMTQALERGEE